MTDSKPPPNGSRTKRGDSRRQVFVGFGVVCLAHLMFHAAMTNLLSKTNAEPSFLVSNTIINDSPIPLGSGLSKGQLQTVLSRIEELAELVKESTTSIHQKLDGMSCTFGRQNPQEVDSAILAASLIGVFAGFMMVIGFIIFTVGLFNISTALRNHVWACGILGANAGLGYLLTGPVPEIWLSYLFWTLGGLYSGIIGGLISDRKNFLLEDEKPIRKA